MAGPAYTPYATTPSPNPSYGGPGAGRIGVQPYVAPLTDAEIKAKRLAEEDAQRRAGVAATEAETAANVATTNYGRNTETLNANKQYIADMMAKLGIGGSTSTSSSTSGLSPADKAASDASFARAKDRQAETIGASMGALKNAASARGMGGSGLERQSMADIVAGGAANLGEFERERALSEVQQRQVAAAQAASTKGQDYGFISSLMGLLNAGVRY